MLTLSASHLRPENSWHLRLQPFILSFSISVTDFFASSFFRFLFHGYSSSLKRETNIMAEPEFAKSKEHDQKK